MKENERRCEWHFEKQTGREEGPSDALGQNFKQRPYASLVRESLQNSLDVSNDKSNPVRVRYTMGYLDSGKYPNFFKLQEHIQGCQDYFYANAVASAKYSKMASVLNGGAQVSLPYIRISDYNTRGMLYEKGNTNVPFYAFVRAASISVKSDGATGGTFGFGKAAYFQISSINTLLVSTMTADGQSFFEGASVLCTHKYKNKILTSVGYYDNNDGLPIEKVDKIPERFRRNESGTDIYIMGYDDSQVDSIISDMREEVLRSFCVAIYNNRLVVELERADGYVETINKDNIVSLMHEVFPEDQDRSSQSRAINPKPYFDSVIHEDINDGVYKTFRKKLPTIGNVKLVIKLSEDAFDKIIYMRRPLMLVYGKKTHTNLGFYGTFICEDIDGDRLLSKLENSSHSEWKKENFRDSVSNKIEEDGRKALKEIDEFCLECMNTLSGRKDYSSMDISGLNDYLYSLGSLIEEDEKIEKLGNPSGQSSDDVGHLTTEFNKPETSLPEDVHSDTGTVLIVQDNGIAKPGTGPLDIGSGHKDKNTKEKNHHITPGTDIQKGAVKEGDGKYITTLNLPIRIIAQKEGTQVFHYVIIHSDQPVNAAVIELFVCGEQSDEKLNVLSSDTGIIKDNMIKDIPLEKGRNVLKITFADNLSHVLRTKLYYEN